MTRYWYEGFLGFRYPARIAASGLRVLDRRDRHRGAGAGRGRIDHRAFRHERFREVLRTRILSLTAHATISGIDGRIPNWRADYRKAASLSRHQWRGAVYRGQGLMTHGDKSSGVQLRGIDPAAESRVVDLSSASAERPFGRSQAGQL